MGNGQNHDNLKPMLESAQHSMYAIGKGEDYFEGKQLSANCNYHQRDNLATCQENKIDAYIPDPQFSQTGCALC